ncbi:MAG: hypothetical protein ACYC09_14895, partial [Bacteroidota bacterium]
YGVINEISAGAYALIKEWKVSEVWHLPVTPAITPPQALLDGKYIQTGISADTTQSTPTGVITTNTANMMQGPANGLLVIQNGIWAQSALIPSTPATVDITVQNAPYSVLDNNLTIAGLPTGFSTTGETLSVFNREMCLEGICITTATTWQKISD